MFRITVAANQAPVLNQPANVTVTEGTTADQTLTGSDPCGLPLTFEKVSGPTFVTVTTTSVTTGVVHIAPGFADAGTYTVTIRACNGNAVCDTKSFTLTVNNVCRPPLLSQPANMTVNQNATADQVVTGSSPDGSPLTFNSTGPPYMTLTRTSATTANIHLAPGSLDSGTAAASVSVTAPGHDLEIGARPGWAVPCAAGSGSARKPGGVPHCPRRLVRKKFSRSAPHSSAMTPG